MLGDAWKKLDGVTIGFCVHTRKIQQDVIRLPIFSHCFDALQLLLPLPGGVQGVGLSEHRYDKV